MRELFENFQFDALNDPQIVLIAGIAVGAMLFVFGLSSTLAQRDPALDRMGKNGQKQKYSSLDRGLLRDAGFTPKGFAKSFVPTDAKELSDVQRQLAMAGFSGRRAVFNYYFLRVFFGVCLPAALLVLVWAARTGIVNLPPVLDERITAWTMQSLLMVLMLFVVIGFYGPAYWLRAKMAKRKRAIQEHFPNALDLVQISVEAGLGFDSAMIRVGNELERTAPEISQEFLSAQRAIQAGQSRDKALMNMAARTGVEEVTSFANVVLQSMQFGTSVSETLNTYATEMRTYRELKAQEKANRLPVQLSAVLATLMLPSLILLTLGPVIIRYVRYF